jgi:hypothetical protein
MLYSQRCPLQPIDSFGLGEFTWLGDAMRFTRYVARRDATTTVGAGNQAPRCWRCPPSGEIDAAKLLGEAMGLQRHTIEQHSLVDAPLKGEVL